MLVFGIGPFAIGESLGERNVELGQICSNAELLRTPRISCLVRHCGKFRSFPGTSVFGSSLAVYSPSSYPPCTRQPLSSRTSVMRSLYSPGLLLSLKGNVWHTGSGAILASKGTGLQLGTLSSPAAMIRTVYPSQRGNGLLISHELLTSEFVLRSCKAGAGLRTSMPCQGPRYRAAI